MHLESLCKNQINFLYLSLNFPQDAFLSIHNSTSSGNSESMCHDIPRINRDVHHHIFPECIAALFAFQGRDVYDFMGQLSWYTAT